MAATATMVWALRVSELWQTQAFWILVSLVVLRYTCWAMQLMVEWREMVTTKGLEMATSLSSRQRQFRAVAHLAFQVSVAVIPAVWLYLLIASVAELPALSWSGAAGDWRDFIQARTTWVWKPVLGLWNTVAAAGGWVSGWTRLPDLLNRPLLLELGADLKGAWPVSTLVASSYGFLIGVWNLAVFSRARWRFRRGVKLDFVDYVNSDPTRPNRGTGG